MRCLKEEDSIPFDRENIEPTIEQGVGFASPCFILIVYLKVLFSGSHALLDDSGNNGYLNFRPDFSIFRFRFF
jgi:hypothetical protein